MPLPFGPTSPTRMRDLMVNSRFSNNVRSPMATDTLSSSISCLVFRSVAEKSISAFAVRLRPFNSASSPIMSSGLADSRFGFRCARLRASPQPFDFRMNAIGERVLVFPLGVEIRILRFQKTAVVSFDAQQPVGIDAMKFDDFQRDILQQVPIVADDDAGKRRVLQHRFEPLDSRKIEMIGGFIEQQNFRRLNQPFDNGQTFLPATGQGSRRSSTGP